MFAGLAWGAGYLDSIPNFEFLTVILFVGGFVLGPAWGALAGALGEFLYSAMNPYGSGLAVPLVLAAQTLGMALAGFAGGLVGRAALRAPTARAGLVVGAGLAVTLVFDLLTNLASAVLFGPIVPTLIAGLPFAAIHAGTNAALFALVGVPLVAALERTRRSLAGPAAALVLATLAALSAGAGPAHAQDAAADSVGADSVVTDSVATDSLASEPHPHAAADSTDRAHGRLALPPAWGDGPAALERRGDGSASAWLTSEGSMTERFADERGSAEPLSRFGLPGARFEVDWLGLSLTGVGAVGGGATRVPWNAVGSVEAPRLPVSAREAYRGEVGRATLHPWAAIADHPRVTAWAGLGSDELTRSGFFAAGSVGNNSGLVAVEAQGFGTNPPLGPEGDHSIALAGRHAAGALEVEAAYRSTREAVEDELARSEARSGEAGRLGGAYVTGGTTFALAIERDDERLVGGDTLFAEDLRQVAKASRVHGEVSRAIAGGEGRLAFTYGRESIESGGAIQIARRTSTLLWGSAGYARDLGSVTRLDLTLGAGTAADGALDVAPAVLLERRFNPGTRAWVGAARGLGARLDPRGVDAAGTPIVGESPLLRSSTWLAGLGLETRSAREEDGGSVRGPWARGERRVRAALYAGDSDPGWEIAREPFALDGAAAFEDVTPGAATRFVALVAAAAVAPVRGVRAEIGGHAMGRTLDAGLRPSDPDWRVHAVLEARGAFLDGDLDLRVGARGDLIGERAGTPAGDLPSAARLGLFAAWTVDEFEVKVEVRDLAATDAVLPVEDAFGRLRSIGSSRFVLEARWTLWD